MSPLAIPSVATSEAFAQEIEELGRRLRTSTGPRDFQHLRRVEWLGRLCSTLGYALAWLAPNPLSVFLLAQGLTARLTIGHHIGHGAYDRITCIPRRYTRQGFARGWRRYVDWLDWWTPLEWQHLHNGLHHKHLGDDLDPDLLDNDRIRTLPMLLRYLLLAMFAMTWKFSYYALHIRHEWLRRGEERTKPYAFSARHLFDIGNRQVRVLWLRNYLPYIATHFLLVPLLCLPLGLWPVFSMFCNAVLAELAANLQGFIAIRSSHLATDIPLFATRARSKAEFFVRQVLGTVNYHGGSDLLDLLHTWTNYQIEHHLWSDLTMLKYRESRPLVKAICAKYGLPYRQESVWLRFWQTSRIFLGQAKQPLIPGAVAVDDSGEPRAPKSSLSGLGVEQTGGAGCVPRC